jgi:hypothetical protein
MQPADNGRTVNEHMRERRIEHVKRVARQEGVQARMPDQKGVAAEL